MGKAVSASQFRIMFKERLATVILVPVMTLGCSGMAIAQNRSIAAPTYYIAAYVKECNSNHITVRGATDLPAGAVLSVSVGGPLGNPSGTLERYSNLSTTTVAPNGQFTAEVDALPTKRFESNRFVAYVRFQPEVTKQPKSVLNVVGRKGEKLDIINNPQAFQTSGWWYGIEETALVGECFNY